MWTCQRWLSSLEIQRLSRTSRPVTFQPSTVPKNSRSTWTRPSPASVRSMSRWVILCMSESFIVTSSAEAHWPEPCWSSARWTL